MTYFEKAKSRRGFEHREHPNAIYLWAYVDKEQYEVDKATWLARLAWNVNAGDTEPEIEVAADFLQSLDQPSEIRFGLTEEQRKRLYWELVAAEDESYRIASERVPDLTAEGALKRLARTQEVQFRRLRKALLKKHGVTEDETDQIVAEAVQKRWPQPPVGK